MTNEWPDDPADARPDGPADAAQAGPAPDPARLAAWTQALAACDSAVQQGDLDAAEAWASRAQAAAEGPAATATALHRAAVVRERRGDLLAALESVRAALTLDEAAFGPAHLAVARDLHSLGVICAQLERPDEAVAALERSRGLSLRLGAPEEALLTALMLGSAYRLAGRPHEARDAFALAADEAEAQDGRHSLRVVRALGGLAEAARAVGALPQAHGAWVEVTRRLAGLPIAAPLALRAELGLAWLGLGLLAEQGRQEPQDARAMYSFSLDVMAVGEHPAAALAAERLGLLGGPLPDMALPRDPNEPPIVVFWNERSGRGDVAHPRGGRWTIDTARAGGPRRVGERVPWDVLDGPLDPG